MNQALWRLLGAGERGESHGHLTLAWGVDLAWLEGLALLAAVGAAGAWFWWRRLDRLPRRWRLGLTLLRAGTMIVLLGLALDPALVGQRHRPGRNFVLVVGDDSQSMQVPGSDGLSRGERVRAAYRAAHLEQRLGRDYQVALFAFGDQTERVGGIDDWRFERRVSNVWGTVGQAVGQMAGAEVAAVVLFSDGVHQGPAAAPVQVANGPPVFAVGSGDEGPWQSLSLEGIGVRRTHFEHSPIEVEMQIQATGLAGRTAVVEVVAGQQVVAGQKLDIAADQLDTRLRLEFVPRPKDWLPCRARVRLLGSGDPLQGDNERAFLVDNRVRTYRVLYVSARPNWEHKFVRRALEEAPSLALSSLIRVSGAEREFVFRGAQTSLANPLFAGFDDEARQAPRYDEAVFMRLGAGTAHMAARYPVQAAELFGYHLVIWGDVERAFFSAADLQLTRDFVQRRGGSLLLGGGGRGLGAGGFAGTVIETMAPVGLGRQREVPPLRFKVQPTIEGTLSGVFALGTEPDAAQWRDLPPLVGVNRMGTVRMGGTVLARVAASGQDQDGQALAAWQRYGEGVCAVLATGDTWPWRLGAAQDEGTHGRVWRQLARALVQSVEEPVVLRGGDELIGGQPGELVFAVRDSAFVKGEGLRVQVEVEDAAGAIQHLAVEEALETAGEYRAAFTPQRGGLYRLSLEANSHDGRRMGVLNTAVWAHADRREWRSPRANPALLRQLAEETGGAFVPLAELDALPDRLPKATGQKVRLNRYPLWHWPPFYGLVVCLLGLEWYWRRKRGEP